MSSQRLSVGTRDGRRLEVLTAGPDSGLPLVFHTGTPSGLVAPAPVTAAASARGLRTVLYARPGYDGSTPRPGRVVADAAGDVAAILDHLGVDRFLTAGSSGGGPHALACAALLPGRCLAAASVAGAAPYQAEGLDWLAGMGPENIEEYSAAAAGENALTEFLAAAAQGVSGLTGPDLAAALGGLASAADTAVLTGEFADDLALSLRAAVRDGPEGWRDDDLAFVRDWGFTMAAIQVPVAVWQGGQDRMVPVSHGAWLAEHVPGARAHLLPGDGHLTLITSRFGEILDDLAVLARLSP
jgi:pimeloyl-ACP methyl ester carboxylesterase